MAPLKVDRWQGHLPGASLALAALLERAAHGSGQFTAAERTLFSACEFWVAVMTRTLAAHLGAHAADALRSMSIVYSAMGSHHVVRALIAGIGEIDNAASPSGRLACLTALQQHMASTPDPVDQLIVGLAHSLGLSAIVPPHRVVGPVADLSRSDRKFYSAPANGAG